MDYKKTFISETIPFTSDSNITIEGPVEPEKLKEMTFDEGFAYLRNNLKR